MERNNLRCQVCFTNHNGIHSFKKHVRGSTHHKKMQEVFQKDTLQVPGFFPTIIVMDPEAKPDIKQPIIGLSLLTLCFSQETKIFFYLCHVCKEKCPPDRIVAHISSGDHCSNYFNYTDPNVLRFSWVPSMKMSTILRPELTKESHEKGAGHLQMLTLPGNLMKKLETSTYSEVMHSFSENDELLGLIEANKPKRMMIQEYQRDSNRRHPLLGMQHLVECICAGETEKRYYLCTLCKLTLDTHMIIKHVLSFDHIYCYFKMLHPSTLMSKESYNDYHSFAPTILDLAQQTEKIHGTSNADMKQVSLEASKFTSVSFNSYARALKELESITMESLVADVNQGIKLERPTVSAGPVAFMFKLCCQNCSMVFSSVMMYKRHVSELSHKQMMKKHFGEAEGCNGNDETGCVPILALYTYLRESSKRNEPVIGVPLVVTCVCTQITVKPIYMCFACEECFPDSFLRRHFNSQKHLINTLLYQNPWRLPFAGTDILCVKLLKSLAVEEEKERGPDQMMLKVLDIPYRIFWRLTTNYRKVIEVMSNPEHYALLKCGVPRRETYTKLKQSERFPLLGQQFLVKHSVDDKQDSSTQIRFLCLLCKRRLSDEECHSHGFCREHVAAFLDCFHPGSLNSSTDAETLLDLAKQAARVHSISLVQVIQLERPIREPCTYFTAIKILQSAKKKGWKKLLTPPMKPKMKLVPRETLQEVDKASQENSSMVEGSEETAGQNSANSETTLKKISVNAGPEIANTHSAESGENAEKGHEMVTPTLTGEESQRRSGVFSKAGPEEVKNAGSGTCLMIEEEKTEEPIVGKPSIETLGSCQNTVKTERPEIGEERSNAVLTQLENCPYKNQRKTPSSMLEDTCPNEGVEKEISPKRQRLTSKEDSSSEESLILPRSEQKEALTTKRRESGKSDHHDETDEESSNVSQQQAAKLWQYVKRKSREPVIGLDALLECNCDLRDPIYLCDCCSLKIEEKDIVSHVTGAEHQEKYLGKLPSFPNKHVGKNIRDSAAWIEQEKGYGEAQVVDLDEEIFDNISQENFTSATHTVRAYQALQDHCHELPLTSVLPAVQSVDTSKTFHTQDEVCFSRDDYQVVKMEIDDAEHCEAAEKANICLPVSGNTEDASSLHLATSGTNTTHLLPDSIGNISKPEIASNTPVAPIKIESASKIVGATQYATTSYSAGTTSNKSPTAISNCPGKPSGCTSDTSAKSSPSISSVRTVTSSSITTTPTVPKLRETACKNIASTLRATTTTSKQTAANSDSSKIENASETAAILCQTTVSTGSHVKKIRASVQLENTEATTKNALVKNSAGSDVNVAPNVPHSKVPAAPHLTKNPPTEPSNTTASKTKPIEGSSIVGLDHLIKLSSERKRHFYCLLCSVRISNTDHLKSYEHKSNYVKKKYPKWNARQSENSSLAKLVDHLAAVEKSIGSQNPRELEVGIDVYKELKSLPHNKAIKRLKVMIRRKNWQGLSVTTINKDVLRRQQAASVSPCEASSPIDETESILKEERNHAVGQLDRTLSLKSLEPDASDQISDRLHPEPVAALSSEDTSIAGERTQDLSLLSRWLEVRGMNINPIIGLAFVWECQGISMDTFFLCESCRKRLFSSEICQHMVGEEHMLCHMRLKYSKCMKLYWEADDLLPYMKIDILQGVVSLISESESDMDAQVVLLRPELHEYVSKAPFNEALKMVQNIKKEPKLSYLPISTLQQKDQQTEERQDESPLSEKQSTQTLEPDQRSDNEERQKTETHLSEETAHVTDFSAVKQRRDLSPLDVPSVSSKSDSVFSLFPGTCHSPQGTSRSLCTQPELRPPVSQDQTPLPELQVKEGEMPSESPSSRVVSPETRQPPTVSPRDQCFSTRKRLAVTPPETLVRSGSKTPELQDLLPAKRTRSSPQPSSDPRTESASESTPFSSVAASPSRSPKDKEAQPEYDEQGISNDEWKELFALVIDRKTERKMLNPYNPETTASKTDHSSGSGVERGWDSMSAQPTSKVAENKALQTPVSHLLKATEMRTPPTTDSLSSATQAKALCSLLPSACTAHPSDSQHRRRVGAQSMFGNVSQFKSNPFNPVATNHNMDEIKQPQGHVNTDSTGVCQLPINPIITARPNLHKKKVCCKRHNHTEVTVSNQGAHSFSPVATASPGVIPVASPGGSGQYSQMAFATNGLTGPLSSEAVAGDIKQDIPPEGYAPRGFYPSRVSSEPEANWFRNFTYSTPQGWTRQGLQQQQLVHRQHYSSWISAPLAAGGEAADLRAAVPFTIPASSAQRFFEPSNISTNVVAPTPDSNNTITQNFPPVHFNPAVGHYLPTTNHGTTFQTPASSLFFSDSVDPSLVNSTPPVFPGNIWENR